MSSMKLWKARMEISQEKRLGALPGLKHAQPISARRHPAGRRAPVPAPPEPEQSKIMTPSKQALEAKVASGDPVEARTRSITPVIRFGEGVVSEEDLRRTRVHRKQNANEWAVILSNSVKHYKDSLAAEKAAKLANQTDVGDALRAQLLAQKRAKEREALAIQEEARNVVKKNLQYELEDLQKEIRVKERNERNRQFVQDQLRTRQLNAEENEKNRRALETKTRIAMNRQAERDRQHQKELRDAFMEDLRQKHLQQDADLKERRRICELERERDTQKAMHAMAAMEAAEREKMGRLEKVAVKVAMLEKDNASVVKALLQKQKEEERRIQRFQDEVRAKEDAEKQEKDRKHAASTRAMKEAIMKQMADKKVAILWQQQESNRIAEATQKFTQDELARRKDEIECARIKRVEYKNTLDDQVKRRAISQTIGLDGMSDNERAINRALLDGTGVKKLI